MQIGLQANAAGLSTGRYGYTATVIDDRSGAPTTFTYSGTSTLINEAKDPTFAALGQGWTRNGDATRTRNGTRNGDATSFHWTRDPKRGRD